MKEWTIEEDILVAKYIAEGKTIIYISKLLNRNRKIIEKHCKILGIKSHYSINKYERMELSKNGLQKCCSCKRIYPFGEGHFYNRKHRQCIECSNKSSLDRYHTIKNNPTFDNIIDIKLKSAETRSKKFNLEFSINFEYIKELYEKQNGLCYYSNLPMTIEIKNKNEINYGISIDRTDSNKGYTKENIVLCCCFINMMKLDLPQNIFIDTCEKIANKFYLLNKK